MKLAERKEGAGRIKRNTCRIKLTLTEYTLLFVAKKATGTCRPISHRTAMLPCCHDADPRTRRCHDARGRDTMVGTLDAVLTINRERSSVLRRSRFCAVETMVDVVDGGDGG
ncbi:hypothetical protein NEUTE1DRAFT_34872 [Neurospora tetrasperma FGSC 2508]|uniref:Uncharacterized protein n=1 Tax=Neurospora tetrasperma (strain FGSC 2508 / ATCC MYA-4615 / P0657) TaxID=510951 RepID=F8MCD2_NEUT8|nr:uncharacterized protein NEUTE1DRAFT_34872 [Neurospora tetrasperma FGSC 2508]EGO60433.1 hypothetical protein NEUTE1DRAFT_34872 [Neurospora tetrasperma FGSC 2508]EGZ75591.1 hypothetical protein NEUTE2DRAFT_59290 [Neurospora tetrasperma FGSC 2509]